MTRSDALLPEPAGLAVRLSDWQAARTNSEAARLANARTVFFMQPLESQFEAASWTRPAEMGIVRLLPGTRCRARFRRGRARRFRHGRPRSGSPDAASGRAHC